MSASNFPTILYQAYGSWQFRKQAILSVQSLLIRGIPSEKIVVFTDYSDDFKDMSVEIISAPSSRIKEWQGPFAYHHRLKIELIHYVFNQFGGPLLYVDSDTIWKKDLTRICNLFENGCIITHEKEKILSESFFPEYLKVLKNKALLEAEGFLYDDSDIMIYNSGVIGLPKEFQSERLDHILDFCDFLSINVPSKMEWVEQLAFSYILPQIGKIETCETELFHYWRDSFEFSRQIKSYSQARLSQLCQDEEQINSLISKGRGFRRSFENQFLLRTNRLKSSLKKRKREMLVFFEKMKRKFSS